MFVTLFGYTSFMIVVKWNIDWAVVGTAKAPSIINLLLDIFIKLGDVVIKQYTIY